ncbi:MAG: hypothetical protein PHO00_08290 [bacterium]|nr:hypothetical protein [bacterium]
MRNIIFALVLFLLLPGGMCFSGDRCRKLQCEDTGARSSGSIKNKGNMKAKTYKGYAVSNDAKAKERKRREMTERKTLRRSMRGS